MIKRFKLGYLVNDVAMGPFGSNLKANNFISSGVPVIRGGNLNEGGFNDSQFVFVTEEKAQSLKRSLAFPDDLVFTHRGTIGQVGIIKTGKYPYYLVSQSQVRLTVNKKFLNPKFLFYWFKSPIGQYELLKNSAQVGVPSIASPTKSLKEIDISIPPLPIQTAIAEILSSLDDKIELNNQINQNLEALAQTLFKQWFVDFEFHNEDGKPYKSSGGEMVDSELGEIPSGWEITKIRSIGKVITGKTPSIKNPHHFGTLIPFVTPSDFKTYFKLILSAERGLSEEGEIAFKKNVLPKNSVIVTCIGSDMGKVAVNREECLTNQQINSIVFNLGHSITCEYTYYYLKSIYAELKNLATGGSTMPIINKSQFEDIFILNPDSKLLLKFTDQIKQFDTMIEANIRKNENLILLRDILLPKLISGELELKEAMVQIS